ncbi:MAG: sigma 54-interacting transcriptional regulator, partial [Pseudomonadales bacterium]|nr:sigma 54-interacting transcriptional regulator [Pseudomonadales bacterium]
MSELPKYRVLIIEDEALIARELKGRLTNMGYEVVGIAYGAEGIELARETRPDLLLTDIHLKAGEDGINVAQQIRAERDVPVVFLTAYSDDQTVSRAKSVTPYGYIIKPVENRELQITIEMALYKFNIERELKETQQLLQNALTCIGNALIFIDEAGLVSDMNRDAETLLNQARDNIIGQHWREVFRLSEDSSVQDLIAADLGSGEVNKIAPFILRVENALPRLVDGVAGPMLAGGVFILRSLSELRDPVESLPGPGQLMSELGPETLIPAESSMCQMLIAYEPDGADETGLPRTIAGMLNTLLRSTDLVSVYGGRQLSVSLPYTSPREGRNIADSVFAALMATDFFGRKLNFSVGLAHNMAGDQQPFELFRRAAWALNVALESGGSRIIVWNESSERAALSGQSDGRKLREYHNVVLLWNLMGLVMQARSEQEMAARLCQHVLDSFDLQIAAVLRSAGESIEMLAGTGPAGELESVNSLQLGPDTFRDILADCVAGRDFVRSCDVLLTIHEGLSLYLTFNAEPAGTDLDFLRTVTAYFATGLRRFEIVPEEQAAVPEQPARLLYRSPQMQSLLESCRLVAPTDATVLISGESGTGKEMLARTIHDNSPRATQPYIIVDCGAVVGSLIESELFGHVKGAFTGADTNFTGRLKEADGGTVLLDEVGELPLDVQVKLLRFVQEREIVPVGSNTWETVDTRVIAATNKDLRALVKA